MHITEGKLTIANKLTDVAGDVSVESTGSLNVTAGGKLEADRLKLETGSSFSNAGSTVISGKLDAEKLSIDNTGSLSIGAGSKLGTMTGGGELHVSGNNVTATDIGTLSALHLAQGTRFTVSQQTTVNKEFSNAGLLVCHDTLTFKQNVDSGGDVTARQLVLQGSRNTFEQVKTDALTLQGLSGTDQPLLAVDSLLSTQARSRAAGSPTIITLLNPDAAWDTYSLITAAHGLEAEAFTLSPETLEAYRNARTEATLHSDGNTLYLTLEEIILDRYERAAGTANGVAAARQMDALRNAYIVEATTHPDLAALMSALDAACELGENSRVEQTATAAAGASIPAMSVALAGDVSRRLRDIRNRMPSMGVDSRYEHPDMPYVNAWLNAEGGYSELESDGTASGYSLSQWGGTVGVDVDATENLTLGVACTALYGDFQADGVDMAEGDMDTCYASLFARWNSSRWVHSFVMTGGVADVTLDRTVNYGNGSYSTSGETDGSSFGLLYELAYTIRGAEDESVCWQPLINISYVHTALDAYTEKGSDAALSVGEQEFDRLSIAAGVRMQAIVAENLYERHAVLELRALAKADIGDREGEVNTAFTALPGSTATLRSNDYGAVGLELGAGLIVPVGAYSGELFFDVSADLRSGYNDVNGAMGWRVHF